MLCAVIKGPSYPEAHKQIAKVLPYAKMVELRLDNFTYIDINELQRLRSDFPIPMIFTLRPTHQGGGYSKTEEERMEDLRNLAKSSPDFLDIESSVPQEFVAEIAAKYPNSKRIISFHDFSQTPQDLDATYRVMKKLPGDFYKIAVMSHTCLDALRLILWAKKTNTDGKLIAISMGPHGQLSRILSPYINNPVTYASIDEEESPLGLLPAETLTQKYRCNKTSPQTTLYGLIGDPVSKSISDTYHNNNFQSKNIDAIYVKIEVKPDELANFIPLAKQLPFRGLSVTMPHKENIVRLIEESDPQAKSIGAVNTLLFHDGAIKGFNTDSTGALNALERKGKVAGQRVVIIGAGGAAKAIAHEAASRGAILTIINRGEEKARNLARQLDAQAGGFADMRACAQRGYDILINCTPAQMPIEQEDVLPNTIVMDIKTSPADTELLVCAQSKGCRIVYGKEMFEEQAKGQYAIWNIPQ